MLLKSGKTMLTALMACLLLIPSPHANHVSAAAKTETYVAFGDSLAVGYEPPENGVPPVYYGYVDRLYEQALFHGEAEVHNYGISGLKTAGLLTYLQAISEGRVLKGSEIQAGMSDPNQDERGMQAPQAKKDIQAASVITVSIGGNDFLSLLLKHNMDLNLIEAEVPGVLADYEKQIKVILQTIHQLNPNARVFLSDQYQPVPEMWQKESYPRLNALALQFSETIKKVQAEVKEDTPFTMVPVREAFIGHEGEYTYTVRRTDIHPTQAGYEAMARVFAKSIWGEYRKVNSGGQPAVVAAGKEIVSPYKPIAVNGVTLVSIKEITDALGAKTAWDPGSKSTVVKLGTKEVRFKGGSNTMIVGGKPVKVKTPVRYKDGKTYVPLRLLVEGLGFHVQYIAKTQTVFVNL
ncbi:stalk domain-containing protein [Paenibacillus gansuensis]|uniref:Stalk domain-containing protein n=1 Tax=Paenibacillus gansuensis TaxID=306542 RepID=A0ABW5PGC8_9BACL